MQDIREKLQSAVKDLYNLEIVPDVTVSPDNIVADYSSNIALKLAKDLHKSPMDIAKEIAEKVDAEVSAPGFINFILTDEDYCLVIAGAGAGKEF